MDPQRIAAALESAPIVARLALTSRNERLRARAATEIASLIADRLAQPERITDDRQMALL